MTHAIDRLRRAFLAAVCAMSDTTVSRIQDVATPITRVSCASVAILDTRHVRYLVPQFFTHSLNSSYVAGLIAVDSWDYTILTPQPSTIFLKFFYDCCNVLSANDLHITIATIGTSQASVSTGGIASSCRHGLTFRRKRCNVSGMNLTHEELAWLFPPGHKMDVAQGVHKLARLLRHNRRLLLKAERPKVAPLVSDWMRNAARVWTADKLDEGDVWQLLADLYPIVAHPLGVNPVLEAVTLALDNPTFPPAPQGYTGAAYTVFRVCHWLNADACKRMVPTWFLSSHALAKAIGTHQTITHRALAHLTRDGFLVVAERGTPTRATRYETRLAQ